MTGHGRRYTSHHKHTCLVRHELAPLSLDWLNDGSRSEGRAESVLSILNFTDALFKAWCCLFNSFVEFSPATKNMLCVVIECTCSAVIDVEAANCCGASHRKSGTLSPPWAGVKATSWRRSLGRDTVWPKSVGKSKSSIASWIGST